MTRQQTPHNRKNMYVHLTDKGRELQALLVPLAVATNRISARGVATADVATARRVLLAMIANLADEETTTTTAKPRRKPAVKRRSVAPDGSQCPSPR